MIDLHLSVLVKEIKKKKDSYEITQEKLEVNGEEK